MAIVNKGFPGTVNATEYAKSWYYGGGSACSFTGWAVTQGTGRQVSVAAGDAFFAGILSTNSAPILVNLSTPVAGQWFLIVRRIDWAGAGTVTVEAVPHTTTTTTIPTVAPTSFPTVYQDPGVMADHLLAWAWVRNTDTTMVRFNLRNVYTDSRIAAIANSVTDLVAGAGRSTGANFPTATLTDLDAVTTAVVGDISQVTLPATGVDPLQFRAVAGSGSGIDWRLVAPIYADTKAHLDAATTTMTGSADFILRIGDRAYAADTAITYRWNGSAWLNAAAGLTPVIPTSVAGTGVTVGADGKVTFTAATAASLNGCFTAAYENYKIILDVTAKSASVQTQAVLRLAGTDLVSANYDYQLDYGSGAAPGTAPGVAQTAWQLTVLNTATFNKAKMEIFSPFVAIPTAGLIQMGDFTITAAPTIVNGGLSHRLSAAYDGITFKPASGNFTGSVRVYGYNNN